jgi:hypothetical protein
VETREQRREDRLDVKRIVAFVLLASTLGMVFFVFFFLISYNDDDVPDEVPGWRGNSYAGLVVDIDDRHLVVHTLAGDNVRFRLDANTRYILRTNEPVRPGIEVKVTFRSIRGGEGQYMQARTVRVLKSEESPSPAGGESGEPGRPSSAPSRSGGPSSAPSRSGGPSSAPSRSGGPSPAGAPSAAPRR